MCGRYAATKDPATLMREFDAVDGTEGQAPEPNYNVAPTKNVVTVVERHPRDVEGNVLAEEPPVRSLRVMRWGLVPFWAKDPSVGSRMINTRAETATQKPAFRKALSRRRCLVPADGWFEWRAATPAKTAGKKTPKEPFYMTSPDGSSLAFAGLWETWRDPKGDPDAPPLITCSVLTTDAVGRLAEIHDRMPFALPPQRWQGWLDPDRADVAELLAPPEQAWVDSLEVRPVSTKVNSVRNNGPELLERVEPEPADLDAALFDIGKR
ncbi:putative SOS response-associated peptidase YedK [Saccharomonospora amisosensis]|uniref:Abasic site processing protein n=1 Tax=Saccharomonospora amisosensis TaxID=1128677 RepID=A0A7X5UMJ2_9PSEU|nr:SOS response-associated peptidase [Saccharomonospora amisosensis]NIJ10774.1 putative SOS response-associated peptidase YedK [Saccharomonospora amisosensis]